MVRNVFSTLKFEGNLILKLSSSEPLFYFQAVFGKLISCFGTVQTLLEDKKFKAPAGPKSTDFYIEYSGSKWISEGAIVPLGRTHINHATIDRCVKGG